MGKLWGSSPPDDDGGSSSRLDTQPQERREPDERSSLLPQETHHHLDPGDPAVSPYNLLSVRSLRWISIFLLFVSVLWWLMIFVATFVSPPGFHTRGGGWFAFAYSTLATGILLVLLLFYGTPSKTERVVLLAVFGFLSVDTIIILAAYPIRNGENWVGIVAVVWALFVAAWAVICDAVVEYGKHEEEERLTGRRVTHHSFREWCSVFAGSILLIAFLVVTILFTINLSIRARDNTLPPPGKLFFVDSNKYQVHIHCVGNSTNASGHKTTTAFLEGGQDPVEGRLASWVDDAYKAKTIQRYCYWDRPGMAFSDNAPSPLSAGMAADALSEALRKAGEQGPWILVSHDFGGIYSRIFASRHTADIRGLLLIDAVPESLLHRIGSPGRGFLLWFRGVIYPLGIDRLVSAIFLLHNRQDRVYGRDAYQTGGQIKLKLQENLVATTFTKNEVIAARGILPRDTPIAVVSSGLKVKKDRQWNDGQRELSKLSDKLVAWDVVNGAPHEVWRNPRGKEVLEKRLAQLVNAS